MTPFGHNTARRSARFLSTAGRLVLLIGLVGLFACALVPLPSRPEGGLLIAAPQGELAGALEAAAREYSSQTGVTVTVEARPPDTYADHIASVLLASLDTYDLVYLPAESLAKWAGYSMLRPLDSLAGLPVLAAWLPAVSVDGAVYGLPARPDPAVLWYRLDLLAQAGLVPPATWPAFEQAARLLNRPPERYAVALNGSDLESAWEFSALLAGFQGAAITGDGGQYRVTVDGAEAVEALEFVTALVEDGLAVPGSAGATRADVIAALRQGQAVFAIAPLSAGTGLRDCQASPQVCQDGQPLLEWVWLPGLPPARAVGGLDAWAVPARAAEPAQAERFLAWLAGVDGARILAENGVLPARQEVLAALPIQSGGPALAALEEYLLPLPGITTADQAWRAYHPAIHAALAGAQLPAQALDQAAVEMRAALRQGGY